MEYRQVYRGGDRLGRLTSDNPILPNPNRKFRIQHSTAFHFSIQKVGKRWSRGSSLFLYLSGILNWLT